MCANECAFSEGLDRCRAKHRKEQRNNEIDPLS